MQKLGAIYCLVHCIHMKGGMPCEQTTAPIEQLILLLLAFWNQDFTTSPAFPLLLLSTCVILGKLFFLSDHFSVGYSADSTDLLIEAPGRILSHYLFVQCSILRGSRHLYRQVCKDAFQVKRKASYCPSDNKCWRFTPSVGINGV